MADGLGAGFRILARASFAESAWHAEPQAVYCGEQLATPCIINRTHSRAVALGTSVKLSKIASG